MRNITKLLASVLLVAGLTACTTYAGSGPRWSGNPKFTVGINAPTDFNADAVRPKTESARR
jgi:hypothetical protein